MSLLLRSWAASMVSIAGCGADIYSAGPELRTDFSLVDGWVFQLRQRGRGWK
jgi:hypothetical protein